MIAKLTFFDQDADSGFDEGHYPAALPTILKLWAIQKKIQHNIVYGRVKLLHFN